MFHERLKRTISARQSLANIRANSGTLSDVSSPKVKLSFSQSSTPSSLAAPHSVGLVPAYRGVVLDPFLPIEARGDHDPSAYIPPPPDDGGESPASRAQLSAMDSGKPDFGQRPRQASWPLAEEFPDTPKLLRGIHDAKLNKGRITALTLDALMRRCKSPASALGVIKNAIRLIQVILDPRGESNPDDITLTGEASVVLLRDYLESVDDRCRTVPGAVETPLITRSAALGAPWPLGNPLVCAAAQVASSESPKHSPPM